MKTILQGGVLAAAMLMGVSYAAAQTNTDGMYVNRDESGAMRVYGPNNSAGNPLLMNENGNEPASCPAGSFYQGSNNYIYACGSTDQLGLTAAEAGSGMPEGAMMLGGSGQAVTNETQNPDAGGGSGEISNDNANTGATTGAGASGSSSGGTEAPPQ